MLWRALNLSGSPRNRRLRGVRLLAPLFVLAVPVLLLATNVRWVANEGRFYRYEFARHLVEARTGLPQEELMRVAGELVDYFSSPAGRLDIRATGDGEPRPFFNPREGAHLADVRGLLRGTFRAQEGALAFVVLYLIIYGALGRGRSGRPLARQALWGAALALALVAFVGALALFSFDWAFLQFHFLAFANDLWLLDPRTDRLIQMFPQGFFYDASLLVGLLTVLEAALLAAAAGLYLRRGRPRGRRGSSTGAGS